MNKTIKLTLFLAIISALATGVLAAVNSITQPIIAANEAGAQTAELKNFYPNASTFETVEFTADDAGFVKEAYKVDETAYVFQVASRGYEDDIVFLVGYDMDGTNSKFKILSNNDTPGFGQRLMEDSYQQGMNGKTTSDAVDMISGVTKSSSAIKTGVDAAVSVFNSLTGSTAKPAEAEVELPKVTLTGVTKGEITESNREGDVMTYLVSSQNFYGDAENVIEVKIDLASRTVQSVSFNKFNDTEGIGDKADTPEFLNQFVGMSIDDVPQEIDGISGSTTTISTVVGSVNVAIEDARNQE